MSSLESGPNGDSAADSCSAGHAGLTSESYAHINISGNATVHLRDTYGSNPNSNQFYIKETCDVIPNQMSDLQRPWSHPNEVTSNLKDEIAALKAQGSKIKNAIFRSKMAVERKLATTPSPVSRMKLHFTFVPLGFHIEYSQQPREQGELPTSNTSSGRKGCVVLIRIPAWFLGYQYSILLNRAATEWKRYVKIYRNVDDWTNYLSSCYDSGLNLAIDHS
jgi:hypothetical protein